MLKIALTIATLIGVSALAQAQPLLPKRALSIEMENSGFMHVAVRKQKHERSPVHAFKVPGKHVKDTCPGGDKKCIKDLIANCDKAGGGLSTQPDGGVDCYVVGIHDQP